MNVQGSPIVSGLVGVERALEVELARIADEGCPPRLAAALQHAVFPAGSRARPRLCLSVAAAATRGAADGAHACAAAVELIHCASLVHDDLPCFDDADMRRGRPTVHCAFGEALALLAGDALIVLAFDVLARASAPARAASLVAELAAATGGGRGLIAGQGWESEPTVALAAYHRAKTGALFGAAAAMGAMTAGADPGPWRAFGERVGCAYQVFDDLADASSDAAILGKPTGRDARLARPSAIDAGGPSRAAARAEALLRAARAAVPECHDTTPVERWLSWMAETWSSRMQEGDVPERARGHAAAAPAAEGSR